MTDRRIRLLKPGELLAMDPARLPRGPHGFFWLSGPPQPKPNGRIGGAAVVYIHDPLEHHDTGEGDSYEAILRRVKEALAETAEDGSVSAPSAVILSIDSPGGVVSGLNECVFALQRLSAESGVPFIAWVDEMAASAAYALACSCEEIVCPKSAILGSVGVISTMYSQAAADKAAGIEVRLITSGARKADGHPHAPIEDAAVEAERDRVNKLAKEFWRLAGRARGLTMKTVASYEATIYLGPDAVRKGLADDIMSIADLGLVLADKPRRVIVAAGGNETDRQAAQLGRVTSAHFALDTTRHVSPPLTQPTGERDMLKLEALIKKTLAAVATEKDPVKLAALVAKLHRLEASKKDMEDDECEPSGSMEDDEEAAKKAKKEEDEAKALAAALAALGAQTVTARSSTVAPVAVHSPAQALLERVTGKAGDDALGAALAMFARLETVGADVASLKKAAETTERADLMSRASKYIPKHLLATIGAQGVTVLRAVVAEAEKGEPIVHTSEGELLRPKAIQPGTEESLTDFQRQMVDQAVANCGARDPSEFRKTIVANLTKAHHDRLNGAGSAQGRI